MTFDFTLGVTTTNGNYHTVAARFKSSEAAEHLEVDMYDDCREAIQQWLDRHYPGERLNDDGDDVENDGGPAEHPEDVLDFTSQ